MWTTKLKLISESLWNRHFQIDQRRARATGGAVIRVVSTEDEVKLNSISDQAAHLFGKWWLTEKVEKRYELNSWTFERFKRSGWTNCWKVESNFLESTLRTWRACLSGNSSRYHSSNHRMNFFQSSGEATTIKQFSVYLEGGSGL